MAHSLLHDRLSGLLRVNAVYPPSEKDLRSVGGADFDLLNIVLLNTSKGRADMLVPTGVNLCTLVEPDVAAALWDTAMSSQKKTRKLSDSSSWSAEVGAKVATAAAVGAGMGVEAESAKLTDLLLVDAWRRRLDGVAHNLIADLFSKNPDAFLKLMTDANFTQHVSGDFVFGVVTEAHYSKIAISAETSGATKVGVDVSVPGAVDVEIGGSGNKASAISIHDEGVIGCGLMSFVCRFRSDKIKVSKPIAVEPGNEKLLTEAHRLVSGGCQYFRLPGLHPKIIRTRLTLCSSDTRLTSQQRAIVGELLNEKDEPRNSTDANSSSSEGDAFEEVTVSQKEANATAKSEKAQSGRPYVSDGDLTSSTISALMSSST